MYKLLIVDDDHMIRNGIRNAINWEEHGISEVETAENGEEAENIFHSFNPNIVLTDIRMPGLDGLELLQRIRQVTSEVKVIILSGYDDFSYAQSALKLGAFEYLLKTANVDELLGVVLKAKAALDTDLEKKNLYLKLKQQLNMSLPLLKHRYLNELIYGGISPKNVLRKLEFIDIRFPSDDFIVSVSEIDDHTSLNEQVSEEERLIYKFGVINIIEELLSDSVLCFESRNEEFVCIYFCRPDNEPEDRKKIFLSKSQEIIDTVSKIFNINISTGISSSASDLVQIKQSYNEAKKALEHKLFTGNASIIHINDVESFTSTSFQLDTDIEAKLMSSLRVGEKNAALKALESVFEQLQSQKGLGIRSFHKVCIELLGITSRVLCEFESGTEEVFGSEFLYFEEIKKYKTFDDAKAWIFGVYEKVVGYILGTKILRAKKIVETAKSYIDEHYNENITLNMISSLVHMSANYFSSLFSNEMGQGLMEYIANRRIEKAKQLLGEKDLKAFEVGEKVGYDNPYYFSRIFKKYTGMSPIEYKESMK